MGTHQRQARDDENDSRTAAAADLGFEAIYEGRYESVYRYVLRRLTGSPADVPDVTAEVFAVAWRKRAALPLPPDDLPWLYGVARRVISRQIRTLRRRDRLIERLTTFGTRSLPVDPVDDRYEHVLAAMDRLRPLDREALQLVMWEGLSHREAARALGCTENAVAIRVHKAKRRVAELLESIAPGLATASSREIAFAEEGNNGPR